MPKRAFGDRPFIEHAAACSYGGTIIDCSNIIMKKFNTIRILDLLFEANYLSIIFLLPIYFAIFFKNNNIFELNKIILFKILVWLMLLIFLIKIIYFCLLTPKLLTFNIIKKKILAIPRFFIILILFLIVLSISTYFSQDWYTAFYGSYNRQQGLASYFFYILFFCLLFLNFKISSSRFNYNKIIIVAVLSSFFVSLYGIAQKFGLDFISWSEPASLTGRVTSSFGQPNYLASYLLFIIPLSVYLFYISFKNKYLVKHKIQKVLIGLFLILILISQLLCLLFTGSRGGWMGLVFGLIISGVIYLLIIKRQIFKKINLKYFFIFLIIIFVSCLVAYNQSIFFRERIKSSFDFQSGSAAIRTKFWKVSLLAIKEKPFFGYGLDNLGDVFVKYYEKDWGIYGDVNDYPDRAHNLILDILLTSGFVGLFFYLAWLFVVFKICVKNIKENKSAFLNLALLAGIICYFISLMFNFEIVTTAVYLWLFFALIIILSENSKNSQDCFCCGCENLENKNNKFKLLKIFFAIILIIIISGTIFWRINKDIKYLIADYYFQQIKQAFFSKEYFKTYVLFGYLQELKVETDYYNLRYSNILVNNFSNFDTVTLIRTGEGVLKKIIQNLKSNNFETIFIKGKVYTVLADDKNKQYFLLAEENLKQALKDSPKMPKIYQAIAELYLKKKDYKLAKDYFNQALDCLPDVNNKYLNEIHLQVIKYNQNNILRKMGEIKK